MAAKQKRKQKRVNNVIFFGDTHCGCRLGLCPPGPIALDDGGTYSPSIEQRRTWRCWRDFWDKWVPIVTKGEPYVIVHMGDLIDGVHHQVTTPISHNLGDQAKIAKTVMRPIIDQKQCVGYYQLRGTEAHVGKSATEEERIAEDLGAIPDEAGKCARYELWIEVGKGLCHAMHHIGTTSSIQYESTAPHKEMVDEFAEAGRWGLRPPDFVIRAHRHRHIETHKSSKVGDTVSVVTPAWQLKTPLAWRKAGARVGPPELGGVLVRQGDEDIFTRHAVYTIDRAKTVMA